MAIERMRSTYRFPERKPEAAAFMTSVVALLGPVAGVRADGAALHVVPGQPAEASPMTALTLAPLASLAVNRSLRPERAA